MVGEEERKGEEEGVVKKEVGVCGGLEGVKVERVKEKAKKGMRELAGRYRRDRTRRETSGCWRGVGSIWDGSRGGRSCNGRIRRIW